jgi:hypothetical protein
MRAIEGERVHFPNQGRTRNVSAQRRAHLKKKFNLTPEQYDHMSEAQHGVCAICGQPERSKRGPDVKPLSVDHDHQTGRIRGLLCDRCNVGLGRFLDSTELLEKALEYLRIN